MKRPPLYTVLEWTGRSGVWFSAPLPDRGAQPRAHPADGPVILVANHESMIDPWILGLATPRPIRYMAKAELWSYPLLRTIMHWFGTFPVERGVGDRAAVGRAGASCSPTARCSACSRRARACPTGERPWLRGAARLALSTGTTIVPVCIVGSERALRPGKFKVGLPRIRVLVGEPIAVAPGDGRPSPRRRQLTARIERRSRRRAHRTGRPPTPGTPDARAA